MNLVASGAEGETAKQLAKSLFCREEIHRCTLTAVSLIRLFSYDLVMAFQHCIGMFVQDGLEVQEQFENRLKHDFKGVTERVIYMSSRPSLEDCAMYSIDRWVSDVTSNSVQYKTLAEDPTSELAFVDVCFMRAFFDTEFPESNTVKCPFKTIDKQEVMVPYMAICDTFDHIVSDSDGFQVAFFPLEAESYGNEWELVVFLPNECSVEGMKELIHFMKAKQLRRLKKNCECKVLNVEIPKFSIQKDVDLMQLMESFGLRDVFSRKTQSSDFNGIR